MSDLSAAAAAALGVPEAIVNRSAAARAAETGLSVDEVLSAWAGGASVAAAAPVTSAPTSPSASDDEPAPAPSAGEAQTPAPTVVIEVPTAAPVAAAAAVRGKPPILVTTPDRPMSVVVGAVALFMAVALVGLVGPSIVTENPGARTSALPYSAGALNGQEMYLSLGCGSCHTQMVRPIVADVGLGAVSLNDSNQVLGNRRFGPDISDIGSRMTGTQIQAIVLGDSGHPASRLSSEDLEDLVAYLVESATLAPSEEEPTEEPSEEPAEAAVGGES